MVQMKPKSESTSLRFAAAEQTGSTAGKFASEHSSKEISQKNGVPRLVTLRCLSQDCIGQYIDNSGLFEVSWIQVMASRKATLNRT
jgi:hypothetical protein